MQAASIGAITRRAAPVAIFHKVAARDLLNLGVRRKILKRQHIVRWEAEDRFRGDCAGQFAGGEYGRVQSFRRFVVGDQDQAGSIGSTDKEWKVERAGQ